MAVGERHQRLRMDFRRRADYPHAVMTASEQSDEDDPEDDHVDRLGLLIRSVAIGILLVLVLIVLAVLLVGGEYLPFDYEGF
jgi:hypothetical protein